MKKYLIGGILVLALALTLSVKASPVFYQIGQTIVKAYSTPAEFFADGGARDFSNVQMMDAVDQEQIFGGRQSIGKSVFPASTASTSPQFMSPQDLGGGVATTTWTVDIARAKAIDINLQFNSSTTASALNWQYEYSYDGIDYYKEDSSALSSLTDTHVATAQNAYIKHTWTPGAAGRNLKNIQIIDLNANYLRLTFNATAATSSLWAEASVSREY